MRPSEDSAATSTKGSFGMAGLAPKVVDIVLSVVLFRRRLRHGFRRGRRCQLAVDLPDGTALGLKANEPDRGSADEIPYGKVVHRRDQCVERCLRRDKIVGAG